MKKPLADFFGDLTPDQRRRAIYLVESLPEDVQSIIFPKITAFSVADSVNAPLAAYFIDIDALNVLKNINNLHVDVTPFFSYLSLSEIIFALKGQPPEKYISLLDKLKPVSIKAKEVLKEQLTLENLLAILALLTC